MSDKLPDILTPDEDEALLKTFNKRYPTAERNRLMIALALETGMRVGDLINLRFEDIELDTGRTHIKMGKGAKDRVLFIRAEILSALIDLADRMDRKPEGLVFTILTGGPVQAQYLRRMIGAQAKKAGIAKRVHFHLLRHTYLTRLYARTKDIRLVQEVAGHASIATTMIYTHVSGEDIRDAMLDDTPQEKAPPRSLLLAAAKLTLQSLLEADDDDKKTYDIKTRPVPAEEQDMRGDSMVTADELSNLWCRD